MQLWRRLSPQARLVNEYGPTETAVGCVTHEIAPDWQARGAAGVSIGRPVDNMRIHILDTQGRLYVTTRAGLQVFDQAGRVNAILTRPQNAWLSNAVFGGKDLDVLYVTCGDKVYRRKTRAKGVLSFQPPVLTPAPRL